MKKRVYDNTQTLNQGKHTKIIDQRCPSSDSTDSIIRQLQDFITEHDNINADIDNFTKQFDFVQSAVNTITKDKTASINDTAIDDIIDNQNLIKSDWLDKLKQAEIKEDSSMQGIKDEYKQMVELESKIKEHKFMLNSYKNQLLLYKVELLNLQDQTQRYCQDHQHQEELLQKISTVLRVNEECQKKTQLSLLKIEHFIEQQRNNRPILIERLPPYFMVKNQIEAKDSSRKTLNHLNLSRHFDLLKTLVDQSSVCDPIQNIQPIMKAIDTIDDKLNNLNDYSSHLYNIACAWKKVIKSFSLTYVKQDLLQTLNNQGISHDLQPAKLLSDISTEGITWSIGYKGEANRAVLKYGVKKVDTNVPFTQYVTDTHNSLFHEVVVGLLLNKIANLTPNFMYTYGGFSCSVPLSTNPQPKGFTSGQSTYDFNDLCSNSYTPNVSLVMVSQLCKPVNLDDFINHHHSVYTDNDIYQLWCQLVCSLAIAYNKYKFIHGDLHGENVLVSKLRNPQDITYVIEDKDSKLKYTIVLKHCRYIARIIDYGHSVVSVNHTRYFPLVYYRNEKQQIIFKMYDIENILMNDNDFYPQFYDIVRLMSYLYSNTQPTTTRINEVIKFKYKRFLKRKTGFGLKLYGDYITRMCKKDVNNTGQYEPFCGYNDWTEYWNQLNDAFHKGGFTSSKNKKIPIKNLAQAAKVYFERLLGGTVVVSTT